MVIAPARREVVFAPRLDRLLREHRTDGFFRLEPDTVGIADPDLMDAVLRARPANAEERPTFKPVLGRQVTRAESASLMQALGADVRAALKRPADRPDLTGAWPAVPHDYLRRFVFGPETRRFRVLVDRRLELTPKLTWSAVAAGAALVRPPAGGHAAVRARAAGPGRRQLRRAALPDVPLPPRRRADLLHGGRLGDQRGVAGRAVRRRRPERARDQRGAAAAAAVVERPARPLAGVHRGGHPDHARATTSCCCRC